MFQNARNTSSGTCCRGKRPDDEVSCLPDCVVLNFIIISGIPLRNFKQMKNKMSQRKSCKRLRLETEVDRWSIMQ